MLSSQFRKRNLLQSKHYHHSKNESNLYLLKNWEGACNKNFFTDEKNYFRSTHTAWKQFYLPCIVYKMQGRFKRIRCKEVLKEVAEGRKLNLLQTFSTLFLSRENQKFSTCASEAWKVFKNKKKPNTFPFPHTFFSKRAVCTAYSSYMKKNRHF